MSKRPYIQNSNLIEIEEREYRQGNARYILKSIAKSKSNWFICEMLRSLYFYLDFDFVKEELKQIYVRTASDQVKTIIRGLHDGTLNVDDLIEQAKINSELFEESQRLQKEYELEIHRDDQLNEPYNERHAVLTAKDIGFLKNKISNY
jgi:hypothetical protein